MDRGRSLDEVLAELRRVFSEEEIDRLLRQATIRQAESAPSDRDYLLQRAREFIAADWDTAQPIVAEFLRIFAHLVASVETLWATTARIEQRLDRIEEALWEGEDEA